MNTEINKLKKLAAEKAVEFVKPGMIIGLGTGSTTKYALIKIAELLKDGTLKNITGIPSSVQTERLAAEYGITISTLENFPSIDLTIDGADEIDPKLNLIKGGGGALLREKVIAQASKQEIIIADESKLSPVLGKNWAVPIEVLSFAIEPEKIFLRSLGAEPVLRKNDKGETLFTDEDNVILDTMFGEIKNPELLASKLESRAGIVEHGLFINLASKVIVAGNSGLKILSL